MPIPERVASEPSKLRQPQVVCSLVALLCLLHAATFLGSGPVDDDFISYRYARNWVEGAGLVFNAGERVEGLAVPLWVMSIALGLKIGVPAPLAALVLSFLASAVAVFAIGRLWQRMHGERAWPLPAILLAASPAFACLGNGLLEANATGRPAATVHPWELTLFHHEGFAKEYRAVVTDIENSYPLVFYARAGWPTPVGVRKIDPHRDE